MLTFQLHLRDATDLGRVRFQLFFFSEMLCLILKISRKWALYMVNFGAGVYQGDHEEIEDENSRAEFLCPFCAEDFDIVGLYCHVDEEHPVEVKNAVRRFSNCFNF